MRIIIVGCGRVGSTLAEHLAEEGHDVTVIDQVASAFDNLPPSFRGRTIEGDVLAKNVLQRAEIEMAEALAGVTNSDSLNALIVHIARQEYGIKRVVARNYDPRQLKLQKAFGIPVIASAVWGAQRATEILMQDPQPVVRRSDGGPSVIRLTVPENRHGQTLQELLPDQWQSVVLWTRDDRRIHLSGAEPVQAGDLIFVEANAAEMESLPRNLRGARERTS